MDTKEAKVQLPSYLIGDLSPKEAAMLEGHLDVNPEAKAAKESLARQLTPVINLQAPEVSQAALAKLFMDARRELVKPENQPEFNWRESSRFFVRVAALVVAAAVLGLIVATVIPQSDIVGEVITANGDTRAVRISELIETPQGVPLTLHLKASGSRLDLDGSAAVMVTGRGHDAKVEIMRGRVIVAAGQHDALSVVCGASTVTINKLSVAAIDFDTPFERIRGKGAVVELQRQTVAHVARVAEQLFGGLIDTTKLPAEVANRRVSIYGVGLRRDEFMATFKNASERFGIVFKEDGKNLSLAYSSGTAGNNVDESESVLKVAPLSGSVELGGETKATLSDRGNEVLLLAGGEARTFAGSDGATKAQRMVVWAGRTDLPHFRLTETVSNYIAMGTSGGKVITLGLALPTGTVLTNDSMRYRGTLVHVGEAIKLDLPGAKNGKLIGVMSSGIEVEGDDATRYFVPVSNSSTR